MGLKGSGLSPEACHRPVAMPWTIAQMKGQRRAERAETIQTPSARVRGRFLKKNSATFASSAFETVSAISACHACSVQRWPRARKRIQTPSAPNTPRFLKKNSATSASSALKIVSACSASHAPSGAATVRPRAPVPPAAVRSTHRGAPETRRPTLPAGPGSARRASTNPPNMTR